MEWLSKEAVKELEPEVQCEAALLSPTTGIIDTHRSLGWGSSGLAY